MHEIQGFHAAPEDAPQGQGAGRIGGGQDDAKFFAAVAGGEIPGALEVLLQAGCRHFERLIALLVPQGIVVGLEKIQVQHKQGKRLSLALGPAPFLFQNFIKMAAVGDPGLEIGHHQAGRLR